MNRKTYLDKTNTIIYNSTYNTSQNPVCELYYGNGYTRILLHFNTDDLTSKINDGTFTDISKLKHILRMKNFWGFQSINDVHLFNSGKIGIKERTSSFDLYLVKIPEGELWDSGVGNDFSKDGFVTGNHVVSENGSNWFNSKTDVEWNTKGVYTGITSGNSNIVSTQHFDIGNEDIEFDITNEVNSIISGNTINNGFLICFDESLEQLSTKYTQYVGFASSTTTTFFKPYLETIYNNEIVDDRNNFYLNKVNRLYFYSNIGGDLRNLDANPVCTIFDSENNVISGPITATATTKGVYYVETTISNVEPETMFYDTWSNIIYNNNSFPNVELEFTTKKYSDYFSFGNNEPEKVKYIPSIYGINHGEKINRGNIRKVFVNPRVEYTTNTIDYITGIQYRLYVKETNKEITVIDYEPINRTPSSNYFTIYTEDLIPNEYFVDIKISRYDEEIIHKEKLKFEIINEL